MESSELSSEFIRAHINTIILKCLNGGEKYGYEIYKYVIDRSSGELELKQPTLYASLRRLETLGFISSYTKNSDIGGKRRYYSLTAEGVNEFNKCKTEWEKSKSLLDGFIGGEVFSSKELEETDAEIKTEIEDLKASMNLLRSSPTAEKIYNTPAPTPAVNVENSNQLKFFDDEFKDINENVSKFKDAMSKLNSTEENASLLNQKTDLEAIERPSSNNDAVFIESEQDIKKEETAINKTQRNDAVFLSAQIKEENKEESISENIAFKLKKHVVEKPKNDATFIYEKIESETENYFESQDDIAINYISSPLTLDIPVISKQNSEIEKHERSSFNKGYSIKSYSRRVNSFCPSSFVKKAKINFITALLMLFISLFQLAVVNYATATYSLKTDNYNSLLLSFSAIMIIYVFTITTFYLVNPLEKTVKIKKRTILFNFAIALTLFIFILAVNNFLGMTKLSDTKYLMQWIIPSLICLNILITSILKFIISKDSRMQA